MLEIEKWMEPKPNLLALMGPILATAARDMHKGFQSIQERKLMDHQFPLPSHLPSWFVLYRQHRKPANFLRSLFKAMPGYSSESIEVWDDSIKTLNKIKRSGETVRVTFTPEEYQQSLEFWRKQRLEVIQLIKDDIAGKPHEQKVNIAFNDLLSEMDMESSFFVLVTVPCWILYKTSPAKLYRRARKGEFSALKQLLRLDPLMMHDPLIGRRIQAFRFGHKRNYYEKLIEIHLNEIHLVISPTQIKYSIGGFLSAYSRLLGKKLSSNDIYDLFRAVAKDYDRTEKDSSFTDTEGSFDRMIRRYRNEWEMVLKSGHENLKSVSG